MDSEHEDIDAVLNMAPTDHATKVVPPAEEPEEMPLPSIRKSYSSVVYSSLLATAFVASEFVLPLVFAFILNLLLPPALRILERLHVPRMVAALLLILVVGVDQQLLAGRHVVNLVWRVCSVIGPSKSNIWYQPGLRTNSPATPAASNAARSNASNATSDKGGRRAQF